MKRARLSLVLTIWLSAAVAALMVFGHGLAEEAQKPTGTITEVRLHQYLSTDLPLG